MLATCVWIFYPCSLSLSSVVRFLFVTGFSRRIFVRVIYIYSVHNFFCGGFFSPPCCCCVSLGICARSLPRSLAHSIRNCLWVLRQLVSIQLACSDRGFAAAGVVIFPSPCYYCISFTYPCLWPASSGQLRCDRFFLWLLLLLLFRFLLSMFSSVGVSFCSAFDGCDLPYMLFLFFFPFCCGR